MFLGASSSSDLLTSSLTRFDNSKNCTSRMKISFRFIAPIEKSDNRDVRIHSILKITNLTLLEWPPKISILFPTSTARCWALALGIWDPVVFSFDQ